MEGMLAYYSSELSLWLRNMNYLHMHIPLLLWLTVCSVWIAGCIGRHHLDLLCEDKRHS